MMGTDQASEKQQALGKNPSKKNVKAIQAELFRVNYELVEFLPSGPAQAPKQTGEKVKCKVYYYVDQLKNALKIVIRSLDPDLDAAYEKQLTLN